ncbi:hypothetical protein [Nonomuraea sp. MG754425]|uniref:hypothetical protein n=1 Tax=Nonomuraea sp. MG754425 TaxID=2570319 RepID=UPI001F28F965|nr:hypothetical protein [Nonomuraea sp. MG754425]
MKPLETRARSLVCAGGSMARNDMARCAAGPHALGSSETPLALEQRAWSRKAADTSAWRDSAQKSSASSR